MTVWERLGVWIRKPTGMMAAGAVALMVIFLFFFAISLNGVQKGGVRRETALSAQYQANQNELSAFLLTVHEQFGLAKVKTDKLDQVLSDAVKGRYDSPTSTAAPRGGQLFSAVLEAYPNLAGLDIFDKVADTVRAGREAYKQVQNKLLDMLREYDSWRRSGIIHSQAVSFMGYPSHGLTARVGNGAPAYGRAAEAAMFRIVLTGEATKAYQTGNQDPIDFGGSSGG